MAAPLSLFLCSDPLKPETTNYLYVTDGALFVTSFVLGVLGATSQIDMGPAGAYPLISFSGLVVISYLVYFSCRISTEKQIYNAA